MPREVDMRFRAVLVIGFGAGYVLGAKAGRERYQQIVEATRAFLDNPGVQRLTDELGRTVNVGKERVSNAAGRKVEQVGSTLAEPGGGYPRSGLLEVVAELLAA